MKTVAIVNPIAGYRRASRLWPRLLASLGALGANVDTWWTEWPGHAETLAARARRDGFDRGAAVGGDGTLLEVVNGLWWESRRPRPSVGAVPFGTGCDYVRSFDLGPGLRDKVMTALGEATLAVSLGLVRLQGMTADRGSGSSSMCWAWVSMPRSPPASGNSASACRARRVTSSAASKNWAG